MTESTNINEERKSIEELCLIDQKESPSELANKKEGNSSWYIFTQSKKSELSFWQGGVDIIHFQASYMDAERG